MNKAVKQTVLFSTVSFSLLGAGLSTAQTNTDSADKNKKVENIVVTGQRQAYQGDFAPLEIPQAELKIDTKTLVDAGAVDLTDALDLSASIARQNNFGGLWNSFAIRGFVGDENLPSNYLVNGFNAGRGFGGPRDLSGVEAVEVLKGPRAALFGRGEPGGTINLITKRATMARGGELRLSAGSFDTYRGDIDWNTTLSDAIAIRLVGFYEDAKSYRDTIETNKQGFSPSFVWHLNNNSQLNYELEYSHQEIPFDRGVVAIDGKLGKLPESRFLGEPGDGPIETDVLGHQLEYQYTFNDSWSALLGMNLRDTSLEGYATENGFGEVSKDGEFNRFRRYRDYDASYQVLRGEISGEFDTAGLRHRLIIGIDADEFENDQLLLRIRGDQYINVYNPVYGAYPLPEPNQTQTNQVETQKSNGIYLQDQISLSDKLDIRIGARYDDYSQTLKNRGNYFENEQSTTTKQTESRLSPQLGLVYALNPSFTLYSSYGENFRPLSGGDADGNGHEPNQSTSIEAGLKFDLNEGRVVGTATVFKVEQDNILTVDENWNSLAIGQAESEGFELDLNGQLTSDLSLWASYAYVDAKTTNDFYDPNFGYEITAGSPLLNIPEHQLSLQLVQQWFVAGKALDLGGGLVYVGERNGYFGQDFELPSYTTVRLFSAYDLTQAIELRLEVNNLFDETYYPNSFSDTWVQPGAPRNFRISSSFKF
ncbi:TonB-dependent siderophore receptor [Agaribacterium haliotis]|uniref:TonB-dependent siderophore receptor n=1 Tax=Agaribacterium haliotis TaxID=2013869 RepID=UPI000BB55D0B|nr:TonB-dependent siderophore receptor [Agaribacterium haliotis]